MKLRQTHIIAMTNQKGGCGKTTATVGLAAALVEEGYSVTIVDTDPQCNATDTFGIDRDELANDGFPTLADAYLAQRPARDLEIQFGERFGGLLTVIPGHRGLGTVRHRLETDLQAAIANGKYSDLDAEEIKREHRQRLKKSLTSLAGERDVILIDTPPDLDFLQSTALIAANWVIIPIFASGYDLDGLETLTRTIEKVRERYNPTLQLLGVLLGNVDKKAKLDGDIYKTLVKNVSQRGVFETVVHRSVRHREATIDGRTIFEHAPGQQAAEQFLLLAREVLDRLKEHDDSDAAVVTRLEANRA